MSTSQFPTCKTLLETHPDFFMTCIGDANTVIRSIRAPEQNEEGSTVFCSQPKTLAEAISSRAAVLVIPAKAVHDVELKRGDKTILVATNVERAMAAVIRRYFLNTPYTDPATAGIHPKADLHATVFVSEGVRIGANAVIGMGVRLGRDVFIGANVVIEANAEIGDGTVIHPLVYIGHKTQIGARCEVLPNTTIGKEGFGYAHDEKGNHYRIPHQGKVVLEDDVHIGANCCIDRGTFGETRIGFGTKIDNQVHIAHNCKVGRNALLTARFAMAGSSSIGDNFIAGGNTLVTGHIRIGDNIQLAGSSGATKDILKPGQYGGFPLLPLRHSIKVRAALVQLPEMRQQLKLLMKRVFPDLAETMESKAIRDADAKEKDIGP